TVAALEVRVGVGPRGRADIAALAVCDNHEPGRAGVLAHRLERPDSVRSERLEEGELQLRTHDIRRNRVYESETESLAAFGRARAAARPASTSRRAAPYETTVRSAATRPAATKNARVPPSSAGARMHVSTARRRSSSASSRTTVSSARIRSRSLAASS